MTARVAHVSMSPAYTFTKPAVARIRLLAGLGVEGDVHAGVTVKHRSRVAADPTQINLRQVHLIQAEIFEELREQAIHVAPGQIGENILTEGIDLLGLPTGTLLQIGDEARIEVTGLRNPCVQLTDVHPDLLSKLAYRDAEGQLVRRAGIMAIVTVSGDVQSGDPIATELPPLPHRPLERV